MGPLSSNLIAKEKRSQRGDEKISPIDDNKISKRRFIIYKNHEKGSISKDAEKLGL